MNLFFWGKGPGVKLQGELVQPKKDQSIEVNETSGQRRIRHLSGHLRLLIDRS